MKKVLLLLLCTFTTTYLTAQDFHLESDIRFDWASDSGFYGKILSLHGEGSINETFSYRFRHRFNKPIGNYNAFDATDLAYIGIRPNDNLSFLVGKQTFLQGGWEYNIAPVDSYVPSIICADLPCYQFALTSKYAFNEGKDELAFQISNNPYSVLGSNKYAVSIAWDGHHGIFHSKYSINWFDAFNDYKSFMFAFGNKFVFNKFSAYLDFISIGAFYDSDPFMNSNTVIQMDYSINEKINLFAKYSFDHNSGVDYPLASNGTAFHRAAAGLEYFPIEDSIRLHALLIYNKGTWALGSETTLFSGVVFNVGVTCRLKLIDRTKK